MKIQLVSPMAIYRESFLRAVRDVHHEGLHWWLGGDLVLAEQEVAAAGASMARTLGVLLFSRRRRTAPAQKPS